MRHVESDPPEWRMESWCREIRAQGRGHRSSAGPNREEEKQGAFYVGYYLAARGMQVDRALFRGRKRVAIPFEFEGNRFLRLQVPDSGRRGELFLPDIRGPSERARLSGGRKIQGRRPAPE